jgi:hypothetical protein
LAVHPKAIAAGEGREVQRRREPSRFAKDDVARPLSLFLSGAPTSRSSNHRH